MIYELMASLEVKLSWMQVRDVLTILPFGTLVENQEHVDVPQPKVLMPGNELVISTSPHVHLKIKNGVWFGAEFYLREDTFKGYFFCRNRQGLK